MRCRGPRGPPRDPHKQPSLQVVATTTAASSPRAFPCARLAPTRTSQHPSKRLLLLSLFCRPESGNCAGDTGIRTQAIRLDSLPFVVITES